MIAGASGVALVALVVLAVLVVNGKDSPTPVAAAPTVAPSAPPSSSPAGPPGLTRLPDPCTFAGDALPADVRSIKAHKISDFSCRWESLRSDRARHLSIEFTLESDDFAGPGVNQAAKQFSDDFSYAGDPRQNGGFEKDPVRLTGLGDEAFTARCFDSIIQGPSKAKATTYNIGGAWVEARVRNVIISIKWRGADYPAGKHGGKTLTGKELPQTKAKQQAIKIAKAAIPQLR